MKSLLNRLTLGEKFLILGLLVVALFGTPTWLMVSNINDQIDFASIEVKGSHYMPRVMRVLQTVQQHRGLSAVVLNGKTELRPQWEAKRQEVDQAFAAVDELDRDNQGLGLTNSWQNIKAKWLAVKGELATFSPSASFARHSEVTQDIIDFVHILSDNANITYDPTVEGYQLGFMAVDHLPSLTENMGKLRAMGSTILSQRKASAEERALLGNFVGLARMEEADAKNSLEKIYSANAELRTTIGKVANDAFAAAANVFQLVDEQIVKADEISYSSGDFTNVATAAIDAQFALVVLVAEQLEKSLQSQMNSLTAKKFTLTTVVFSLFAVCVLISWVIARSISKTSRSLAEGLARIAKGDMSVQLADSPGRDELAVMQRATRRMLSEISRIIASVRAATQNITSASEQVSSTAQSLSQASSEQAASVEETSASVEQMSASVKQNAESANVTDGIATKAAKDAVEGGKAVNETVKAMKAIAEQISIIDDIAYQTNLLALNAAIEAARAGEHGKGFAVVASEVRQLAQRSQVAAQEITQVASSSVELAEQAGRLLNEIVPSIQKTSELVQEIAAASEEQSTGVGQVNTAMEQLNQITQTNAAASEELASTAEEMSGQAEQLQKLMRFFKLASKRKKEDEEDDLPIVDEDAEDDVPNDTDIEDDGIQAKDDDVTSDEEDIVDEEEEESVKLVANGNKAVIKGKSKGKTKSKSKSKGSRDESGFVSF